MLPLEPGHPRNSRGERADKLQPSEGKARVEPKSHDKDQ